MNGAHMKRLCQFGFALCVLLSCSAAFAGGPAPAPSPVLNVPADSSTTPQHESETPSLEFTYEQRARNEDWNNTLDYNNATDDQVIQMRYKEHAALTYRSAPLDFQFGFASEIYKRQALTAAEAVPDRWNWDEVVFESLHVNLKKLPVPGLSLSVGRQDLERGEGFMLWDGTSGDGSRSNYFNAVDFAYRHAQSRLEAMGILDPRQDRFLPILHNQHTVLNEWDEQAAGLYYTDRNHPNSDVDAYYFYKKEINDYRDPTNYQFQPDRHINTVGARLAQRLGNGISLTGEFAGQWGKQHANAAAAAPAADIRAWGGYAYVSKTYDTTWKPYIQVGYTALSGDDPNKPGTLNGFDPLFSRWPKWSELYLYSLVPERGVAYWTNIKMAQIEGGLHPIKPLTLRATWYEQSAFHPFAKNPVVFASGTHRGENYQARAEYVFNQSWKCHLLYEKYVPGNFYAGGAAGFFVQAQVVYRFSATLFAGHPR